MDEIEGEDSVLYRYILEQALLLKQLNVQLLVDNSVRDMEASDDIQDSLITFTLASSIIAASNKIASSIRHSLAPSSN